MKVWPNHNYTVYSGHPEVWKARALSITPDLCGAPLGRRFYRLGP